MIEISLTPAEHLMASAIGGLRLAESQYSKRKFKHGQDGSMDLLGHQILGAAGEIAVARALGRYWGGDVNTFKGPDLGKSVQVRTRSSHNYDLIVRDDDDPSHAYVLVTGTATRLRIHGWIYGAEAQKDEWLKSYADRPPAWFVPKSALRPIKRRDTVEDT